MADIRASKTPLEKPKIKLNCKLLKYVAIFSSGVCFEIYSLKTFVW